MWVQSQELKFSLHEFLGHSVQKDINNKAYGLQRASKLELRLELGMKTVR